MCKRNFKIVNKYIILMDYDYSNIFTSIDSKFFLDDIYNIDNFLFVLKQNSAVADQISSKLQNIINKQNIIHVSNGDDLNKVINSFKPDILLSLGWRSKISSSTLNKFQIKLNFHPALLPEYKGYHPIPYVIINNENIHGITVHSISEGIDEGDILLKEIFNINKFSTVKSLLNMSEEKMPKVFFEVLNKLEKNDLNFISQDSTRTKIVAPKRYPSDSKLDPSKSLYDLYDLIRASDLERFPAFFEIEGEKVFIKIWREKDEKENEYDL